MEVACKRSVSYDSAPVLSAYTLDPIPAAHCTQCPRAGAAGASRSDGLITVTNTDSSRLVASCRDFTGTTTPMHDLAVNISSGGGGGGTTIAAAAWLDHVIVFAAPWQASTADVLCNYRCPQVRQIGNLRRHYCMIVFEVASDHLQS